MAAYKFVDLTDIPIGLFAEIQSNGGDVVASTPTAYTERFIGTLSIYGGFYVPEDFGLSEIFDTSEGFLVNVFRHAFGLPISSPGGDIPFSFRLPKDFRVIERPYLEPPETSPHTLQYQAYRLRSDGIEFRLFSDSNIPFPYLLIPYPFAVIRFATIPKLEVVDKRISGVDYGTCSC